MKGRGERESRPASVDGAVHKQPGRHPFAGVRF